MTTRQFTRLMYDDYKCTHSCEYVDVSGKRCGKRTGLEFHHKDPLHKVDTVGNMVKQGLEWGIVLEELQKCTPLCHKHHASIHAEWRRLGFWK